MSQQLKRKYVKSHYRRCLHHRTHMDRILLQLQLLGFVFCPIYCYTKCENFSDLQQDINKTLQAYMIQSNWQLCNAK